MKVVLGSDHVGLHLKWYIARFLSDLSIEVVDVGTDSEERVDYPVFGSLAAHLVGTGQCDRGVVICGTGVGISIAANKVPGVRCVACSEPYSAVLSRQHNDTNMLALGARVVGVDLALMIVEMWMAEGFDGDRHSCRVEQLTALENGTASWIENLS